MSGNAMVNVTLLSYDIVEYLIHCLYFERHKLTLNYNDGREGRKRQAMMANQRQSRVSCSKKRYLFLIENEMQNYHSHLHHD